MMCTPCQTTHGDERDERILDLLCRLVNINTEHAEAAEGAPFGEGCARALALVLDECAARGFAVERVNDMIGWAQVGTAGPLVGFPVHLDVVLAGDGWSRDPFTATIVDGVLYGRGVMDNKISAAILIELLDELKAREAELPCRFRIVFGTDEESGMGDMRSYLAAGGEQPEMGFVPDAAFPVINGEKAQAHVVLTHAAGLPEGVEIAGGTMSNVVPSDASARVSLELVGADAEARAGMLPVEVSASDGVLAIRASGRSAHASTPQKGENAIAKLVNAVVSLLPEEDAAGYEALRDVARCLCADTDGTALGIDRDDDVFGGTTVNLGILSADVDGVTVDLDIRYGRGIDEGQIVDTISSALGDAWTCEVVGGKPVHLVDEGDACVRALLGAYERVTGLPGSCSVMGGGTYASLLPALVAFGPKFPDTHCGAHGVDEHVSLENIVRATDVYREALQAIIALAAKEEE